jgi:hypothetical protein
LRGGVRGVAETNFPKALAAWRLGAKKFVYAAPAPAGDEPAGPKTIGAA